MAVCLYWQLFCLGVFVIAFLIGHILYAAVNHIAKVEDDFLKMEELKVRAEVADVAKYQFLSTVSHEIRTSMNGVLGMLQMLLDIDLDATQQDYA
jgi:histidine kinase 2/3/4 (cytokinin receptor)